MDDRRLKELLAAADAVPAAPATSPAELASRARDLFRRRQRGNRALAAMAVLAMGTLVWQSMPKRRPGQLVQETGGVPTSAESNAALAREDLRRAMDEVRREEQIVERLLAAERLSRLAATAEAAHVGCDLQNLPEDSVSRAALAILLTGDRKRVRPELRASAGEDYASVIDLFPNTMWAEEAKQRLLALQP